MFAACNSFACSMHVFFYSFFFVCSVQEMICLTCYLCLQGMSYLQCFLFVKAVSSVGHRNPGQDFRITPYINYAYIHCLKNKDQIAAEERANQV